MTEELEVASGVELSASGDEVNVMDDDGSEQSSKKNGMDSTERPTNTSSSSGEEELSFRSLEEEENLFQLFTGMKEDLDARVPLYKDDWSRPRNIFTVVNATLFAFVIQLIPALIFAELMNRETEGNLATAETLLSSAIIGIIYACLLDSLWLLWVLLDPVALLLGTSYSLTDTFDAEYFAFFFWTAIWAGLMHVISAMIGLVSLVWKVTPFTSQIFELFIAITFIYSALRDLIEPIYWGNGDYQPTRGAEWATLFIGLLTMFVAWTLHFAETWTLFTRQIRIFLESYNTLIAVVIGTAFSYLPGVDQPNNGSGGIDRVNVVAPWDWQPTADRPWVVNPLEGIGAKGIFGAMIPGFMFFLLFIIDHNVSSILTQSPKFNLKKPPAYHWDFFVLGITFIPCAILGLPPGNGLIPQAPLHCRALCTRQFIVDPVTGVKKEVVTHCEEQRWSGLGQALLMFVALSAFTVISWIPRGCLFGLFLYLGMGALYGNEIWERFVLCFMLEKKRPKIPVVSKVKKWRTTVIWTFIQAALAFAIFAVAQFASVGYLYPALLTALVPVRSYILNRFFDEDDLKHLDPYGETEEEYHDEQQAIHLQRNDSFTEEELDFPNRGEFRAQGIHKELRQRHQAEVIAEAENRAENGEM